MARDGAWASDEERLSQLYFLLLTHYCSSSLASSESDHRGVGLAAPAPVRKSEVAESLISPTRAWSRPSELHSGN
jgi:hypothetical protein